LPVLVNGGFGADQFGRAPEPVRRLHLRDVQGDDVARALMESPQEPESKSCGELPRPPISEQQ